MNMKSTVITTEKKTAAFYHIPQTCIVVRNLNNKDKCEKKLTRPQKHLYWWLAGDLKLMLKAAMEAN